MLYGIDRYFHNSTLYVVLLVLFQSNFIKTMIVVWSFYAKTLKKVYKKSTLNFWTTFDTDDSNHPDTQKDSEKFYDVALLPLLNDNWSLCAHSTQLGGSRKTSITWWLTSRRISRSWKAATTRCFSSHFSTSAPIRSSTPPSLSPSSASCWCWFRATEVHCSPATVWGQQLHPAPLQWVQHAWLSDENVCTAPPRMHLTIYHSLSLSLQTVNPSVPQTLSSIVFWFLLDCLHGIWTRTTGLTVHWLLHIVSFQYMWNCIYRISCRNTCII